MKSDRLLYRFAFSCFVVLFITLVALFCRSLLSGEQTEVSAVGEDMLKDPLTCYTIREYKNEYVRVWTDPDTGIEYLLYTATGRGGICPRYNPDGSLRFGGSNIEN